MSDYELALILKPSLSDSEIKKTITGMEKKIEGDKGKILDRDDWGRRKMSYKINKEDTGYYFFLKFSLESEDISKIGKSLPLEAGVMRYLLSKK